MDRLSSVVRSEFLFSDAEARRESIGGTAIGISSIKRRRPRMPLRSRQGLCIGDCVPFYFCLRSVMLYKANQGDLSFRGGQGPIVQLEADLGEAVAWLRATACAGPSDSRTLVRHTSKTDAVSRTWTNEVVPVVYTADRQI